MTAPVRYFAQPYGFQDACAWLLHNVAGPSQRHRSRTSWLPRRTRLAAITPALRVVFMGDLLPLPRRGIRVSDGVRHLFAGADLVVGNLEGTVATGPLRSVFMGQTHTPALLDFLGELVPPDRTVLTCANNHAGDYGPAAFEASLRRVEDTGIRTLGRVDAPSLAAHPMLVLTSATAWSNRPADMVAPLDRVAVPPVPEGSLSVLCPHWGWELEAYPRPPQIAAARRLLERWDLIVGHHSHCPQPVATEMVRGVPRLVAWSLGNFTAPFRIGYHRRGLVLTLGLGSDAAGRWRVGEVGWDEVAMRFPGRGPALLGLAEEQTGR
ncbi:MAG: CapA family protein [Gemmatimonadales bacterium]